jgi:hypothetical protein
VQSRSTQTLSHTNALSVARGHLFTWGEGKSGCLGQGDKNSLKSPAPVRGFGPSQDPDNTFGKVLRYVFEQVCIYVSVRARACDFVRSVLLPASRDYYAAPRTLLVFLRAFAGPRTIGVTTSK